MTIHTFILIIIVYFIVRASSVRYNDHGRKNKLLRFFLKTGAQEKVDVDASFKSLSVRIGYAVDFFIHECSCVTGY